MAYERLADFVQNRMRMSHVYQPVMLMTLLRAAAGLRLEKSHGPYSSTARARLKRHIAVSAADNGIPYVEARLGEEGMSPDGVQPNDEGYRVIAERLRELEYGPLAPR